MDAQTCVCPAGKTLYGNGSHCVINGYAAVKFQGAQQDCVPCEQRDKCLRTPAKTQTRQVAFFQGKADGTASFTDQMKARIDSPEGQAKYGRRFAAVSYCPSQVRAMRAMRLFAHRPA